MKNSGDFASLSGEVRCTDVREEEREVSDLWQCFKFKIQYHIALL